MQVDECNISRNLGNNLYDSVHRFGAIAQRIMEKNSKHYKSSRAPGSSLRPWEAE